MEAKPQTKSALRKRFDDSAHLRKVLFYLHDKGTDTWRTDPVASELIAHIIDRFASLARKHGLEPEDSGPAAFEAIRQPGICTARDPWGWITKAIATTLRAEQIAQATLCDVDTARQGVGADTYVERFSDRETEIWEHDPAFVVTDEPDLGESDATETWFPDAELIGSLFTDLAWPAKTVGAISVVMARLAAIGNRPSTYEALRRDRKLIALVGLPRTSWSALLRLLLGSPQDANDITDRGKGILLRLACGESVADLAWDDDLTAEIVAAAPRRQLALNAAINEAGVGEFGEAA